MKVKMQEKGKEEEEDEKRPMILRLAALGILLGIAEGAVYRQHVPTRMPADYQEALDKASSNWNRETTKYQEFVEMMETTGAHGQVSDHASGVFFPEERRHRMIMVVRRSVPMNRLV